VSDPVALFERSGALLRGHFTYTSGRHGAEYIEKFRLLEDPKATTALCGMIAAHFAGAEAELVAGPTTGGIILAYEVARQLGVRAVYAERGETGSRVLRRGFTVRPGERVLVVDDIVTTGGSVRDMLTCVEIAGGTVVGVGVLGDRTGGRLAVAVAFFACLTVDFPSYAPAECPLCAAGIPVSALRGSGAASAVR
jgi:orotate phosphoribosyltransferase